MLICFIVPILRHLGYLGAIATGVVFDRHHHFKQLFRNFHVALPKLSEVTILEQSNSIWQSVDLVPYCDDLDNEGSLV